MGTFNPNRLPAAARDILKQGAALWPGAVLTAAELGLHDVGYLTDVVFFAHHAERHGQSLSASETSLIDEWKAFRTMVAPIVAEAKKAVVAVLIVPNQGHGTGVFLGVARALKAEVYNGKAIVVKATLSSSSTTGVKLSTDTGGAFSWDSSGRLKTVMTISHGGICDGPNLDHNGTGAQPWGVVEKTACTDEAQLGAAGAAFWRRVAGALRPTGKVVLLGCHMGESNYARLVAEAMGRTVYAPNGSFAAGNKASALSHVEKMETGKETGVFKRF